MLAHVPFFGRNPRGSPDFLAYPVPKACLHVLCTGVPMCLGVARSASSPKAAQALGCSLTPGLRISFGRVTCMARAAAGPSYGHWVSYCCVALVLGFGFCGNTADSGWGLAWEWLGKGFGFSPQFLAGACGVCGWAWVVACTPSFLAGFLGVRGCVRVPPVPHHSWPGRAVWVCVFGPGCGCALPLLAGVSGGVRVCVRSPSVPRHFWLACAMWVCVPGLGLRLRPAVPGWGVKVCVCLCVHSARTPLLLVGMCRVCVFVCVLRLYPAIPGGVVCVFVGLGIACTPLFSGSGVWARGLLRAPRPFSATFWWGCLWCGGVRELPWVVFVPPPLPFFFFLLWTAGGGGCGFWPCRVMAL